MTSFIYKGRKFTCKNAVLGEVLYLLFDAEQCKETAERPPVFDKNYWKRQSDAILSQALNLCKGGSRYAAV